MRILVVSDLHYRLRTTTGCVEAAGGRGRRGLIAGDLADVVSPVPHEVQTVVLTNYLGLLAERTTVLAPRATTTSTGRAHHGEQVAGWLRRADHGSLHVDGVERRHRRHPVHRLPVVGRPDHPRRGRRPAGRGGRRPPGAVGVALPRAAGRHAAVPRRPP